VEKESECDTLQADLETTRKKLKTTTQQLNSLQSANESDVGDLSKRLEDACQQVDDMNDLLRTKDAMLADQ